MFLVFKSNLVLQGLSVILCNYLDLALRLRVSCLQKSAQPTFHVIREIAQAEPALEMLSISTATQTWIAVLVITANLEAQAYALLKLLLGKKAV